MSQDLAMRDPQSRLHAQFSALQKQLQYARRHSTVWQTRLAQIDLTALTSSSQLAQLPLLRKADLYELQQATPPLGGLATCVYPARVFASPGPIYEPEGQQADFWRLSRALAAAGFVAGDVVQNCFSYHFTPGGLMLDSGARALGCTVFPAGVGQTEQQVYALRDLRPSAYTGTPSFLKIILEKADEMGVDSCCLRKAVVTGEALPASLRQWFMARSITVHQCYATADLGLIAYETTPDGGLWIDEGVMVEIIDVGSGVPVAGDAVGEVVVTLLNTPDYPLVRFATGDLSAWLPVQPSPCGRTAQRIKGWLGRADQTTKIKGMFVHPHQISAVAKRHPELEKVRLQVTWHENSDRMVLLAECANPSDALAQAVVHTLRELTKLRGDVQWVAVNQLPNDGKVIDDARRYD